MSCCLFSVYCIKANLPLPGTFAFYIKAWKATPDQIAAQRPSARSTLSGDRLSKVTGAQSSSNVEPNKNTDVLLVEDNLLNQKIASKQLEQQGCTVHVANHGREALNFLKKTKFWRSNNGEGFALDVIFMDWEMPEMDGLTATRKIREFERQGDITHRLRIVAMTANARPEQIQMALDAGMVSLPSGKYVRNV